MHYLSPLTANSSCCVKHVLWIPLPLDIAQLSIVLAIETFLLVRFNDTCLVELGDSALRDWSNVAPWLQDVPL
jgi:hypothetical protein